jgi:hypothetical protein
MDGHHRSSDVAGGGNCGRYRARDFQQLEIQENLLAGVHEFAHDRRAGRRQQLQAHFVERSCCAQLGHEACRRCSGGDVERHDDATVRTIYFVHKPTPYEKSPVMRPASAHSHRDGF